MALWDFHYRITLRSGKEYVEKSRFNFPDIAAAERKKTNIRATLQRAAKYDGRGTMLEFGGVDYRADHIARLKIDIQEVPNADA